MSDTIAVRNLIYPPVMDTYQHSNCIDEPMIITYTMPEYNLQYQENIKSIHIALTNQSNNTSVLASGSVKVLSWNRNPEDKSYHYYSDKTGTIVLDLSDTIYDEAFQNNIYKIQLRFDFGEIGNTELNKYLIENTDNFSEWSTVSLIKPIKKPKIDLIGMASNTISKKINYTFNGYLTFANDETDSLKSYCLTINDKTSGIVIPDEINHIKYSFDLSKEPTGDTILVIEYLTNNGYNSSETFDIKIIDEIPTQVETDESGEIIQSNPIVVLKNIVSDEEYGYNEIIINTNAQQIVEGGNEGHSEHLCEIFRSIDGINWDKIDERRFNSGNSESFTVKDIFIESGLLYKYCLQASPLNSINTYAPTEARNAEINDFYNATLLRQDRILKLSFDFAVSSYTKQVGRSMTETLGGRYPKFTKNGRLNYKKLSISGKISIEDNLDGHFISIKDLLTEELYNNLLESQNHEEYHNGIDVTYIHNQLPQSSMIMVERKFREEVYDWLNDSKPKLFKSGPEGNMIVILDGINLSPEKTIGRLVYNFSATMYEIADAHNYSNLISFGII